VPQSPQFTLHRPMVCQYKNCHNIRTPNQDTTTTTLKLSSIVSWKYILKRTTEKRKQHHLQRGCYDFQRIHRYSNYITQKGCRVKMVVHSKIFHMTIKIERFHRVNRLKIGQRFAGAVQLYVVVRVDRCSNMSQLPPHHGRRRYLVHRVVSSFRNLDQSECRIPFAPCRWDFNILVPYTKLAENTIVRAILTPIAQIFYK
jgi:hypothetical protein